jgi:large subunit ribosomal protein L35
MGYKLKPNKAVAKRFKVTRSGKVKRGHSFRSHLMSVRPSKKRRKSRRPALLAEGLANNMRRLMQVYKTPGKTATARAQRERAKQEAATAEAK